MFNLINCAQWRVFWSPQKSQSVRRRRPWSWSAAARNPWQVAASNHGEWSLSVLCSSGWVHLFATRKGEREGRFRSPSSLYFLHSWMWIAQNKLWRRRRRRPENVRLFSTGLKCFDWAESPTCMLPFGNRSVGSKRSDSPNSSNERNLEGQFHNGQMHFVLKGDLHLPSHSCEIYCPPSQFWASLLVQFWPRSP